MLNNIMEQIPYTKFTQNHIINMEIINLYALLLLHWFLQNTQSLSKFLWTSPIINVTQNVTKNVENMANI